MSQFFKSWFLRNSALDHIKLSRRPSIFYALLFSLICIFSLWQLSQRLSLTDEMGAPSAIAIGGTEESKLGTGHGSENETGTFAEGQTKSEPTEIAMFWEQLAKRLYQSEPKAKTISTSALERDEFDPHGGKPRTDLDVIKLPPEDFESLQKNHAKYAQEIKKLAKDVPFVRDSRGIVITSRAPDFGIAITAILMLRHIGSKLPVELFLDSSSAYERNMCEKSLGALDVRCLNMDDFLLLPEGTKLKTPKLKRYQFKVFSILFSSFQNILFLDADAFPIKPPDHLFDVEPYTSHGLVTWPDFWLPTISPLFYEIAGAEKPAVTLDSRSSESGVMLYNKAVHAESLLLAVYYNFYGPNFYYPLQSQGAWGSGDKETFLQSAMVLGKPVWPVKTYAQLITGEGTNYGSGIWQADPEEDWKLHSGKLNDTNEATLDEPSEDTAGDTPEDTPETSTNQRRKRENDSGIMFAHLNRVKIDTRRVSQLVKDLLEKDKDKPPTRVWGSDSDIVVEKAGFDLEKVIWEEIIQANCMSSMLEECEKLRKYYDEVFG